MTAAAVNWNRWLSGGFAGQRARHRRYLITALAGNACVWLLASTWLLFAPPSYVVQWSMIVPGNDPDARVNLVDVGQAYGTSQSLYDSRSLDPRANYREIALSDLVTGTAAAATGMDAQDFPQARVKLIDQSSVMTFAIAGSSPERALQQARALDSAFQRRLDALRSDEATRRDQGVESAISSARLKLDGARRELVEFKTRAGIVSRQQIETVAGAVDALETRRRELDSKRARERGFTASAASHLRLDDDQAAQSLLVQGDATFASHYKQFVEASTLLADYSRRLGAQHPRVQQEQSRRQAMVARLAARASELMGEQVSASRLERLLVNAGEPTTALVAKLVESAVEAQALDAEYQTVSDQVQEQRARLDRLVQDLATLDELEQRVSFAEAILTNTLGKVDVGRANPYASYPLVQELVPPALPRERASPSAALAILGALGSSMFLTIGLTLAYLRQRRDAAVA